MKAPPPKTLDGCRVLVLEDEYFLADDLDKELKRRGAKVIGPIADLRRAKDQIALGGFDVAVVDINLRGEQSWVIADELARENIPFSFATGYSPEVIPERFRHIPVWQKPFDLSKIAEGIQQLCSRSRTTGQARFSM